MPSRWHWNIVRKYLSQTPSFSPFADNNIHSVNARGLMSGILQQGYSFGYVLAACANLGVGGSTESWKTVFWIAGPLPRFSFENTPNWKLTNLQLAPRSVLDSFAYASLNPNNFSMPRRPARKPLTPAHFGVRRSRCSGRSGRCAFTASS